VTVRRFIDIERRELLADKARELMKVAVKVAPVEVKQDFVDRQTQVNLEFARFSPRRYEDDSEIAPAELDAYVKAHDADLRKQYDDRSFLYKKTDKTARLRHIVVEVKKDATPAEVDAAKKQIDAAAAKVKAGTAFTDVARTSGSDEFARKRSGLIGWRKKGFTGLGAALDGKVFEAKKGAVIGPERTERGFELVLVEDFREGDISFEQAARELAEDAVRGERSKAKAKLEAESILARVKKGEKLEELLPKETAKEAADERQSKSFGRRLNEPPKLLETQLFARRGELVQEIGVSKDLSKRAFELKPGELAGPFEVAGTWVIVRLKERRDADPAEFEKRKDELTRELERTKWAELLDDWSKQRCVEVRDEGRIKVNDEVLVYEGLPPGRDRSTKYEPCASTKPF
jgi:parvulin-like peptidyl-prolyl isomerase